MKEKILDLIKNPHYRALTEQGLLSVLDIKSDTEKKVAKAALKELVADYIIVKNKRRRYVLLNDANLYIGKIDIKNKGFGFISSPDLDKDYYVSKDNINDAMNKDTVLFKIIDKGTPGESDNAAVVEIIERGLEYVVGEVYKENGKFYLRNDDVNSKMTIELDRLNGAVVEHKAQVKIKEIKNSKFAIGDVSLIIGHRNDVGIDILSIAIKHHFIQEFPKEVMDEVNGLDKLANIKDENRVDLTKKTMITIDGADAKDLDDAVSVEMLANGNYLLGVYIADVSYFVRENTALDKEAFKRSTSSYLADRVIPMLPHKISNDLCSLNAGEYKKVIACEMEINKQGEIVDHKIFPALVNITQRMTYQDVNLIIERDPDTLNKYQALVPFVLKMDELSLVLLKKRIKRGTLDFDIPEGKIIVDERGQVLDIELIERKRSERIIEEFMITANETVAESVYWLELPFLYRVHDNPNKEKLKKFLTIAKNLGYNIKARGQHISQSDIQKLLENIKEEDKGLNTVLLRMMAKAKYSDKNLGHYGLASEYYTHFTAPIRRYSDLIVHRLIRKYLFSHEINKKEIEYLTGAVTKIATQTSARERAAIDCENEVNDMKKAEYMEQFIGEVFEGVISSVTNFGMFVSLPNTVEGLVHVLDMKDDYYDYFEEMMVLMGRATKKQYRIGDTVKVRLTQANKQTREINFELVYNKPRKKKRYNSGWDNGRNRKKNNRKK